ncbi:MAG TPA: UDP-N-acetylmuramoyl-tripeptide--D-alanyl-D-alanine ligase, partial [bacterium]
HFGEIRRLCEVAKPTHGVITNVGKGHLEFFKDENGVARAKAELLEALADRGLVFLNGDDPHLIPYRRIAVKTVTYGFGKDCDLRGEHADVDRFGFPKMTVAGQTIRLSIFGRYNLTNALAAVALGRTFGIPWPEIQERLWRFRPVTKRAEPVRAGGILFVNDTYNANPSSMEQSLIMLKELAGIRRRIAVLGDMLELGKAGQAEHARLGEAVAAMEYDGLWATGKGMRHAVTAARDAGMNSAVWFDSKPKLIEALSAELQEGDGVLVKGSRLMRMEDVVEELQKRFGENPRE